MLISLIIPCYNEAASLPIFYQELCKVADALNEYSFEFLFVDDGSTDGTLSLLKEFGAHDDRLIYFSLARNFGKEAAMYAGFCNAKGDYVAVLDADMQDPPALLPEMLRILESDDYDSVAACRKTRKGEPPVRSFFAKMFYRMLNEVSDTEIVSGARDFRLMKRKMVNAIVAMSEYNRFSKGIFEWVGFRTYWLSYENVERVAGKTKWSFWKLFKYSMDSVVNFSQVPLSIASWGGLFFTFLAFLMVVFVIVRKLLFGDPVAGWPSTVCIIMFIGGIQLFCMGIIGQYIAKIYLETKHRPHYIITETNTEDVIIMK